MESNLPKQNPIQQGDSVTEPSLASNPASEQNKSSKKHITWIFLLISLILVVVVAFFAYQNNKLKQQLSNIEVKSNQETNEKLSISPTSSPRTLITQKTSPSPKSLPDKTENWQLYSDSDLNYSIKYPLNFEFTDKSLNSNYIIIRKPGGEVESTGAFSHFTIAIEQGPQVSTLEEAIEHYQEQSRQINGDDMQFTTIMSKDINKINALSYYQEGPIGYQQNFVLFNSKQQTIHINVIFSSSDVQKDEQGEVDTILSTFKLIE